LTVLVCQHSERLQRHWWTVTVMHNNYWA